MNAKLKSQIKTYTGVAGALLAANKASGQIVYVDVNPDTLVELIPLDTIRTFLLDVDQDSAVDFKFNIKNGGSYPWSWAYIRVHPYSNNKINNSSIYISSSTFTYPQKLNAGDTINNNGIWLTDEKPLISSGNGSIASDHWHYGNWSEGTEAFLPFLLVKNSNNFYGWMRIKIVNNGAWYNLVKSFILKDYAYNTIPNAPIIAGDTTNTSLGFNELSPVFQIRQHNNLIQINAASATHNAVVKIYDLLGKEILTKTFSGNETALAIDKKGIYFVEVRSEKGISRKKVFIY